MFSFSLAKHIHLSILCMMAGLKATKLVKLSKSDYLSFLLSTIFGNVLLKADDNVPVLARLKLFIMLKMAILNALFVDC